jgi:hypothetical protein
MASKSVLGGTGFAGAKALAALAKPRIVRDFAEALNQRFSIGERGSLSPIL